MYPQQYVNPKGVEQSTCSVGCSGTMKTWDFKTSIFKAYYPNFLV